MRDETLSGFAKKYPNRTERSCALFCEALSEYETDAFGRGLVVDYVVVAPVVDGRYVIEVHYVGEDEWNEDEDGVEDVW